MSEVLEMQNFTSTYTKGRAFGRADDYVTTIDNQIFSMVLLYAKIPLYPGKW